MPLPALAKRQGRRKWWWVYLLRCADGTLYCGATVDLAARLVAHNGGRGAKYTRSRRPVSIVYKRRKLGASAALAMEARLKRLTREEKLALIGAAP